MSEKVAVLESQTPIGGKPLPLKQSNKYKFQNDTPLPLNYLRSVSDPPSNGGSRDRDDRLAIGEPLPLDYLPKKSSIGTKQLASKHERSRSLHGTSNVTLNGSRVSSNRIVSDTPSSFSNADNMALDIPSPLVLPKVKRPVETTERISKIEPVRNSESLREFIRNKLQQQQQKEREILLQNEPLRHIRKVSIEVPPPSPPLPPLPLLAYPEATTKKLEINSSAGSNTSSPTTETSSLEFDAKEFEKRLTELESRLALQEKKSRWSFTTPLLVLMLLLALSAALAD